MKVYVEIKDKKSAWVEEFDEGTTEDDIKKIISEFNSGLRPYETARTFVKIVDRPIDKFPDKFRDLSGYSIGRKEFGGYVPLRLKVEGKIEPYIYMWIRKDFILQQKKNKTINNIPEDKLKDNLFKCQSLVRNMFLPTDFAYVRSECQRCPLVARSANRTTYFCRLKEKEDGRFYEQ